MLVVYTPHEKEHAPESYIGAGRPRPHPDVPDRAQRLLRGVAAGRHDVVEPGDHGLRYARLVHTERYLDFLGSAHEQWLALRDPSPAVLPNVHPRAPGVNYPASVVGRAGMHMYDLACPVSANTFAVAVRNSHSAAEAALQVASGGLDCAYALCRPPGHHSGADYAGGFCYLNNAAIAAEILREEYRHVAVLDVDVHHGNGTQDIFYERADVFVASLHGDPADFYPFYWGHASETGAGPGAGATLNIPLPRGLGDDGYLAALDAVLAVIRARECAALVVSVGFDAYEHDPLSCLRITTPGFARIAAAIGALGLPTVLVQEGGYLCSDLDRNVAAFLEGFLAARRGRA